MPVQEIDGNVPSVAENTPATEANVPSHDEYIDFNGFKVQRGFEIEKTKPYKELRDTYIQTDSKVKELEGKLNSLLEVQNKYAELEKQYTELFSGMRKLVHGDEPSTEVDPQTMLQNTQVKLNQVLQTNEILSLAIHHGITDADEIKFISAMPTKELAMEYINRLKGKQTVATVTNVDATQSTPLDAAGLLSMIQNVVSEQLKKSNDTPTNPTPSSTTVLEQGNNNMREQLIAKKRMLAQQQNVRKLTTEEFAELRNLQRLVPE